MAKEKKQPQTDEIIEDTPVEAADVSVEPASDPYAELNDKYLRLAAEYDNFRKRSKKERESLFGEAAGVTISAFLPMLDALDNAQRNAPADGLDAGVTQLIKLAEEILKRLNVTVIDPAGTPFDAEVHNAIMHIEDESIGQNTVVEVFQKGYSLDGKVIRHATVKVAN